MTNEAIGLMEPMKPSPLSSDLQDLALDLSMKASRLAGTLHPKTQLAVGALVRSMNCYYSNLIEGHDTHPYSIDRALNNDLSSEPEQRDLQVEARAHIRLQELIDTGTNIPDAPISSEIYIKWLHKEFCDHLPDDLLWVENSDTGERIEVIPGQFRDGLVAVGRHIPPAAENLNKFLQRFNEAYDPDRLGSMDRIVSVAASHHRLLWIHPFYDGNGRVVRLLSHAYLKHINVGSSLWSVARGLARNIDSYKTALASADNPRQGDLDGRGSLSNSGLESFCSFFLKTCLDQVEFMEALLRPDELLRRIEIYVEEEVRAKRLPQGSFPLLREAVLIGEFDRGRAPAITAYKDRQARSVLKTLTEKNLLISNTPKGAVRLNFPVQIVERWFPSLYPQSLG